MLSTHSPRVFEQEAKEHNLVEIGRGTTVLLMLAPEYSVDRLLCSGAFLSRLELVLSVWPFDGSKKKSSLNFVKEFRWFAWLESAFISETPFVQNSVRWQFGFVRTFG